MNLIVILVSWIHLDLVLVDGVVRRGRLGRLRNGRTMNLDSI